MDTPVLRGTLVVLQGVIIALRSYRCGDAAQISRDESEGLFPIGPRESVDKALVRHARELRHLLAEGAVVANDYSPLEEVKLEEVTAQALALLRSIPLRRELSP